MSDHFWLREEQLARIKPYFPLSHGVPRVDDRKVVSGTCCTSLDMAGCSITLTKMDEKMSTLWKAPVHTAAFSWNI